MFTNSSLTPLVENEWNVVGIKSTFNFPYTPTENGLLTLMVGFVTGDCYLYIKKESDSLSVARSRSYGKDSGTWQTVTFPVLKDETYVIESSNGVDSMLGYLYKLGQ